MSEAHKVPENISIYNQVEKMKENADEFLSFLEERATDAKNGDADQYTKCYEQLVIDGKIKWTNVTISMFNEMQSLPFQTSNSREIFEEAFFDNGDYRPLHSLAKLQKINPELLGALDQDRIEPSEEFVRLFKSELIKTITAKTRPISNTDRVTARALETQMDNTALGAEITPSYDIFVLLCQFYRLGPDFTDKLAQKLGLSE